MLEMVSGARTVLCKGNASSVFLPMTNATNRCAQGDTQSHQPRATACGPRAVEVTSGSREHNPYSLAKGITRMHWILSGTCQMGDTWQVTLPYWPPPPPPAHAVQGHCVEHGCVPKDRRHSPTFSVMLWN